MPLIWYTVLLILSDHVIFSHIVYNELQTVALCTFINQMWYLNKYFNIVLNQTDVFSAFTAFFRCSAFDITIMLDKSYLVFLGYRQTWSVQHIKSF